MKVTLGPSFESREHSKVFWILPLVSNFHSFHLKSMAYGSRLNSFLGLTRDSFHCPRESFTGIILWISFPFVSISGIHPSIVISSFFSLSYYLKELRERKIEFVIKVQRHVFSNAGLIFYLVDVVSSSFLVYDFNLISFYLLSNNSS